MIQYAIVSPTPRDDEFTANANKIIGKPWGEQFAFGQSCEWLLEAEALPEDSSIEVWGSLKCAHVVWFISSKFEISILEICQHL